MISLFGASGFLGTEFRRQFPQRTLAIPRKDHLAQSSDILYMISTTDNYNVFTDPHLDVQTNLVKLLSVLENLKPNQVFNFVSSWFVYGNHWQTMTLNNEMSQCHPKGFYSITKRCAEQLIESYCTTHKIPYRIFRLSNIYGPGDQGVSAKKNAMQFLINKVKKGEDVELYYGGDTIRDYLHVFDACCAIDLCMRKAPTGSITNIGSGKRSKLKNIIQYARLITKSKSKIIPIDAPEFHKQIQIKDFWMDVDKLVYSYGFKKQISLKEGIRELCEL